MLGQETKQTQGTCEADIGLEPQFAKAFRQCCTEMITTTTKSTTTETMKFSPESTLSSYAPLPRKLQYKANYALYSFFSLRKCM